MSLVSCIMAKMQGDMGASDCEDIAANLKNKIMRATEQGSELGKMLSNIDNQIDQAKYSFRELQSLEVQAYNSQDPRAQQALGAVQQRKAYCNQAFNQLQQRKIQLEAEKKRYTAQEKELEAQQTKNDVMMKLQQASAEKFGKMIDPAIKRFFGG